MHCSLDPDEEKMKSLVWWHMLILAVGRQRQENYPQLEASLGYRVMLSPRPSEKKIREKKMKPGGGGAGL